MAQIAVQNVTLTGLVPTFGAAAAGDTVPADGKTVLWVVNGSGSSVNVTIVTPQTVSGLAVADEVVAVPAGAQALIGPFPRATFGDVNGNAAVNYSATTSVTRAAIQF